MAGKLIRKGGEYIGKKTLTTLNTGFLGYEVGNVFSSSQNTQPIIYNTTIVKTVPEEKDYTHTYIVIGFLVLVILLLCFLWALKITFKVRRGDNSIELNAIPAHNVQATHNI